MKKRILIALVVVLALAATASLVWAGDGGGKAHANGTDFYNFYVSAAVMPAPPYGTIDIPGSGGRLNVNQPQGAVSVVITGRVDGLLSNRTYKVYLLGLSQGPGYPGYTPFVIPGGWVYILNFTTDGEGHGDFHINLWASDLSVGTYNLSVWINDASAGKTLLISDNFQVQVEP